MTDQTPGHTPNQPTPSSQTSLVQAITEQVLGTIDQTDEQAAAAHIATLQQLHPDATTDELAERILHQRCIQAAAVGAATSGAAIIPGLGTAATLIFGVAADLRMTYQIQSELVLELAALYGRPINLDNKRYVVGMVTGMSAGANQVVRKTGAALAEQASKRLAQRAVAKSIPVIGVAASAGVNLAATYLIGRRAQAYFRQDPADVTGWEDQARLLSGIDERKLTGWLVESVEDSWRLLSRRVHQVADGAADVSRSAWRHIKNGVRAGAAVIAKRRTPPTASDQPNDQMD